MLSWETQQNFTEEVNPGLRCAGLEFLQDTHPLWEIVGKKQNMEYLPHKFKEGLKLESGKGQE